MNTAVYNAGLNNLITSNLPVSLVKDAEEHDDAAELTAHVRSGEYFAMLATRLDALSDRLAEENEPEQEQLQRIADDLLELQRSYKITRKD